MTLKQEELTEALHAALKAANPPCGRLCVAGIEAGDGTVTVWHNGTGSVKGDHQIIHAEAPLKFSKDQLAGRLKVWIEGQHRREYVDLNAALEIKTGGWIEGGPPLTGFDRHGPNTVILPNLVRALELNTSDFDDASGCIEYYISYPSYSLGDVVTVHGANVGITPYITTTLSPNVNTTWRWSDGTAP